MRKVAVAALALAASGSVAGAQGFSREMLCNPASNPYDAVAAAPYSHRVQFEDAHVRVLEINLPPGASEPVHIHALPSVIMGETGGEGAKFLYTEYRWSNEKFVETGSNEVSPTGGYRTVWSGPEGPHAITNTGAVGVKFMRVEIKPEACSN